MPAEPTIIDLVRYGWHLLSGFRANHERRFFELRRQDVTAYLAPTPWRVLDLANGRLRPQTMLLRSQGHRVTGVDLVNRPQRSGTNAVYALARRWFACQQHLPLRAQSAAGLLCGDVSDLPLVTGPFDLITSMAAFEHFLNVPVVMAEAYRVLRPGGLIWVCIHPFSCLSGGHNISLSQIPLRRLPRGVAVWDHLRQRRLPFHVPLNEWRIGQYVAEFSRHFEIVKHYVAMREGEEFLTPDLERELAAYSREELTCLAYIIVARKP